MSDKKNDINFLKTVLFVLLPVLGTSLIICASFIMSNRRKEKTFREFLDRYYGGQYGDGW